MNERGGEASWKVLKEKRINFGEPEAFLFNQRKAVTNNPRAVTSMKNRNMPRNVKELLLNRRLSNPEKPKGPLISTIPLS